MYETADGIDPDPVGQGSYNDMRIQAIRDWVTDPNKSLINFDQMIQRNFLRNQAGEGGIYMIEERHTDQRDFNFAANVSHTFRNQSILRGGVSARINRTEDYDEVKGLLGADSWRDVDKFAAMHLTAVPAAKVGTVLVEESPVNLECKVTQVIPLGSHDLFLAECVAVDVDERLLDESGKLCLNKAKLIVYSHGDYLALGRKLGSFGYSVRKKKKIVKK